MTERQEIHCHNCGMYVRFDIDMSLDGNHVLECPVCGHEHCRVVKNGVVTEDRWDSRNGQRYRLFVVSSSSTSIWSRAITSTSSTSNYFVYQSWLNTNATSGQ
jgi:hypothetical protein